MSFRAKVMTPVIIMLLYIVFSTLMIHNILNDQKAVAPVINIAGRQRMLTQKMTKELLLYLSTKDQRFLNQMKNTMQIFEISLNALINSGKVPTSLNLKETKWMYIPGATGKVREQLLKVKKMWETFKNHINVVAKDKSNKESFNWIVRNNVKLLKEMNKAVFMMQHSAKMKLEKIKMYQYAGLGIGVLTIALTLLALLMIERELDKAAKVMSKVTENDTVNLKIDFGDIPKDEVGKVMEYVSQAFDKIASKMKEISLRTVIIGKQIPRGMNSGVNVTMIMEEYKAMITEITNAIGELNTAIKDLATEARKVAGTADEAMRITQEGMEKIRTSAKKSEEVEVLIKELANEARSLKEASDKIFNILNVINEISDQTSLLALNAAIEAARAGEHGRGFAVVADEVRKLAEQTQKATKDIEQMVALISEKVNEVTTKTTSTIEFVKEQVEVAEDAINSFEEVYHEIKALNDLILKVSSTTEEQAAATSQIANTASLIRGKSQEVSENVTHFYESFRNISLSIENVLDSMQTVVFAEGVEKMMNAIKAHVLYVNRILEFCIGIQVPEIDELVAITHETCDFGKFIASDEAKKLLDGKIDWKKVHTSHRDVHRFAAMCVEAKRRGDVSAVKEHTDVLAEAAYELIGELIRVIEKM